MNPIAATASRKLIVQSNRLIEARYSLSLAEQRLLLMMLSMIGRDDRDFQDYTIHVRDFGALCGLKRKDLYEKMQEITEQLLRRVLHIDESDGPLQIHWLSSAKYVQKEGQVRLAFDPRLKPYLLMLKEQFTRFSLLTVARFRSVYSIRIYALLKQYERLKVREFELDDLRKKLDIQDGEYTLYANFKMRVLKKALDEININSDLAVTLEEEKKNRRVVRLRFRIQVREDHPQRVPLEDVEASAATDDAELLQLLVEQGIAPQAAQKLISEFDLARIQRNLALFEADREAARVLHNQGGYLASAIREDFAATRGYQTSSSADEATPASPVNPDPVLTTEAQDSYRVYVEKLRLDAYRALPMPEREALEHAFAATLRNPVDQQILIERGIEADRRLRERFAEFLARRMVGTPLGFRAWATGEGYRLAVGEDAGGYQVVARIEKS